MKPIARSRRFLLAGASLGMALALFHNQLAAAVVTRGDDVLRGGDVDAAIRLYDRAARLDAHSIVAADRLAFHLALRHDRTNARLAVAVATRALHANAGAAALFADRALAELQLHAWRDAERDFDRAGELAHDPRYEHFAGRMALRAGDRGAAKRYARRALADDPSFAPARALLRRLE
jgi:tetratricopeptide (TPR) repeat protein